MSVNNGARVDVDLPDFSGKAGFTVRGVMAELSYATTAKKGPEIGSLVEIDGEQWTVIQARPSPYRRGVRNLTLRQGA